MVVGRLAGGLAVASVTMLVSLTSLSSISAQVRPPKPPDGPREPAPRLPDGTPNLGRTDPTKGYWAPTQYQDYTAVLVDPKEMPYQPWAKALVDERKASASLLDPQGFCLRPPDRG